MIELKQHYKMFEIANISGAIKKLRVNIKMKQKYGEAGIVIKKYFQYQKLESMAFEAFKTLK